MSLNKKTFISRWGWGVLIFGVAIYGSIYILTETEIVHRSVLPFIINIIKNREIVYEFKGDPTHEIKVLHLGDDTLVLSGMWNYYKSFIYIKSFGEYRNFAFGTCVLNDKKDPQQSYFILDMPEKDIRFFESHEDYDTALKKIGVPSNIELAHIFQNRSPNSQTAGPK